MDKQVNCIMLIDDNKIDNFFHERVIKKHEAADIVISKESACDALKHLKSGESIPEIIFLDVNMPCMNGWDFIEEFKKDANGFLDIMIVIFTSDYEDPDDEALEATKDIFADFRPKPLTKEILDGVLEKYYKSKP